MMSDSYVLAVQAAIVPALVLGAAFGARDALRAIRYNAYVQLSRYFWLYVATSFVSTVVLAGGAALVVATIGHLVSLPEVVPILRQL